MGTPFEEAVQDLTELIDDVVLVPDSSLITAMQLAHKELGLVLEPAGAAGLAALLDHREQFQGRLVGTVLTGGNVSPANSKEWLVAEPAAVNGPSRSGLARHFRRPFQGGALMKNFGIVFAAAAALAATVGIVIPVEASQDNTRSTSRSPT